MKRIALLPGVLLALFFCHQTGAAAGSEKTTDAQAKMFTMSAGYERFMGRWSRIMAPAYVTFAGVKDGDRVLDVGTGTGALASAVEAATKSSEIVGIDPSEGFISHAKKNAKSGRSRFEIGDAQALSREKTRPRYALSVMWRRAFLGALQGKPDVRTPLIR